MAQRRKNPEAKKVQERPMKPGQFHHKYRLQTISLKEIVKPLKQAVLDIESYVDSEGEEHVLTAGTLINALVFDFLQMPPERRRHVALTAVARLEAFRDRLVNPGAEDSDVEGHGDPADIPAVAAHLAPRPPDPRGEKKARKKSG